eukprot:Hpha_TRINITY_DN18595_c0_g1::TRINITY_DN18595_c0_g1_i1::g.195110::m.195110
MFHVPHYIEAEDEEGGPGPPTPSTPCPNYGMHYEFLSAASLASIDCRADFELPLERALVRSILALEDRLVRLPFAQPLRRPKGLELAPYRALGVGMQQELQNAQVAEWSAFHSLNVVGCGRAQSQRRRTRGEEQHTAPIPPSPQRLDSDTRAESDAASPDAGGGGHRLLVSGRPPPMSAAVTEMQRQAPCTPPRPAPAPPRTPGGGPPRLRSPSELLRTMRTDGEPPWSSLAPRARGLQIPSRVAPGEVESPFGGWVEEVIAEDGCNVEVLAIDASSPGGDCGWRGPSADWGVPQRTEGPPASGRMEELLSYLTAEERRRLVGGEERVKKGRAARAERRRRKRETTLGLPPLSPRSAWREGVVAACVQELWQSAVVPALAQLVPPQGIASAPVVDHPRPPSTTASATTNNEHSVCDLSVSQSMSVSPSLGRGQTGSRADSRTGPDSRTGQDSRTGAGRADSRTGPDSRTGADSRTGQAAEGRTGQSRGNSDTRQIAAAAAALGVGHRRPHTAGPVLSAVGEWRPPSEPAAPVPKRDERRDETQMQVG